MDNNQITLTLQELVEQNNILTSQLESARTRNDTLFSEIDRCKLRLAAGNFGKFLVVLETGNIIFGALFLLLIVGGLIYMANF